MEAFMKYLEEQIALGKADVDRLERAGRRDDAVFAKIRTNIYDICRTVANVHTTRTGLGEKAVGAQLARFRSEWGAALEKARAGGNAEKIAVEETKMAALSDVIARFGEETGR